MKIKLTPKDILLMFAAVWFSYLMITLGLEPDGTVGFNFNKLNRTVLFVMIPIFFIIVSLLFAHWHVVFEYRLTWSENNLVIWYRPKSLSKRNIHLSRLFITVNGLTSEIPYNNYGIIKEVKRKYGQYDELTRIESSKINDAKYMRIELNYVDDIEKPKDHLELQNVQILKIPPRPGAAINPKPQYSS